ncbi:MAG: hypothetical protein JWM10_5483 [Myxococcaceae bacterium]|nr:hypothetical protein [Myxococcaceae bacterium]
MRLRALGLSLALSACASDPTDGNPPPLDAGDVPAADLGRDALVVDVVDDRPGPTDTGAIDARATDAGGVRDGGIDVVAVGDATDAAGVEAATDGGLTDGGAAEVPADRPDAVVVADVPADMGPIDGGLVVYDLEAARGETSYRVIVRETLSNGAMEDCDSPPTATSCSVAAGTLQFSLRTCGTTFTGRMSLSTSVGRVLSISSGGGGSSATTLRLESGRRVLGSPPRRSFHVQAAAPAINDEPVVSGVPGRTVDPALADLWLLGCPSE